MRILILEDNLERRSAMLSRVKDRLPFLEIIFYENAHVMINCMAIDFLNEVVLISLDNDLEMIQNKNGTLTDPGSGELVANWLADLDEPVCPIIIATTNTSAGDSMVKVLKKAKWQTKRIVPFNDLDWVYGEWFPEVRNAIVGFTPKQKVNTSVVGQPNSDNFPLQKNVIAVP